MTTKASIMELQKLFKNGDYPIGYQNLVKIEAVNIRRRYSKKHNSLNYPFDNYHKPNSSIFINRNESEVL